MLRTPWGELAILLGCLGFASVSCSLTIDTDGLKSAQCQDDEKACEVQGLLECVDLDNPDFGCARVNCVPCYLEHAQAICSPASGQCVIGNCINSWEDCDGADSNGCEVDLNTDPDSCGGCGIRCEPLANAKDVRCGSASCYIRKCDAGFGNCNEDDSDGCEVDLLTAKQHCGKCSEECDSECVDGLCVD